MVFATIRVERFTARNLSYWIDENVVVETETQTSHGSGVCRYNWVKPVDDHGHVVNPPRLQACAFEGELFGYGAQLHEGFGHSEFVFKLAIEEDETAAASAGYLSTECPMLSGLGVQLFNHRITD